MNKNELIVFLKDPSKLTTDHLNELEEIIDEDPYFLSARLLLAKGSKELKDSNTKKRVGSAAIYSTDRILLKKYLSSNLFFLDQAVAEESAGKPKTKKERIQEEAAKSEVVKKVETEKPREDVRPSALKPTPKKRSLEIPSVPSGELDSLLDELQRDMENLKSSRHHFAEVQQKIEEEDAISEALDRNKIEPDTKDEQESDKIAPADVASEKPGEKVASEKQQKADEEKVKDTEIELDPTEEEIFSKKLRELAQKKEDAAQPDAKKTEKPRETTSNEETAEPDDDRAEKSIDEPRFSRFATRSYLKDLSAEIDDDFNFFGDEEEDKKVPKKEVSEEKVKVDSKEPEKKEEVADNKKNEKKTTKKPSSTTTKPTDKKAKASPKAKTTEKKSTKAKPTVTGKAPKTEEKSPSKAKAAPKSPKKKASEEKAKTATEKKPTKKASPRKKSQSATKKDTEKNDSKDEGKADRSSQRQIIDKFIKESPSIKYVRKDEASSSDLSEHSGAWDTNLASEYLAEIYLHQGNKKRAKEIYEALILKYPEKKSYFADLISKIE